MPVRKLLMAIAILAFGHIGCVAWAGTAMFENQSENHPPSLPPPADSNGARQKWFLDYVKEIADYPHFDDANYLAQLLRTHFTVNYNEDHYKKKCDSSDSRRSDVRGSEIDIYIPGKDFWFKAMPGGIPHMHLPGGGIFNTPAQDLDDPKASISISKLTTCGGTTGLIQRFQWI